MFEKVNPSHPDKIADRIAGAIVDYAYSLEQNPKVAVEVLIGHGVCHVIIETTAFMDKKEIKKIIKRIGGKDIKCDISLAPQDYLLMNNQQCGVRCGDNGIFKGVPTTTEQMSLRNIADYIYDKYKTDGKYIMDGDKLVICQSNAPREEILRNFPTAIVNPLGYWTGGTDVDTGATNRKLGSDMGDAVTGGGLHGKDLSKADVSVNIYAYIKAQETGQEVNLSCAIGDFFVDGKPYEEIVEIAREYINAVGGFEAFAMWGLI